jgi:hypothetical protein
VSGCRHQPVIGGTPWLGSPGYVNPQERPGNQMVTVTLAREWVDAAGVVHPQGSQVEIEESILDDLVADGYVAIGGGEDGEDGVRWS